MKRMSRALALVLALIMLTSLCACGRQPTTSIIYEDEIIYESNAPRDNSDGSTSDGNSSGGNGTGGNNSGSTGGKTEVINNCYTSGTKIAKDKITFKVLARDYTGGQCNFANSDFTKYVEKNLNIKLEWTTCVQSEVSTKLTLAYASSTNPYDLYMGVAPSGHTAYIQQGKLTKLNSYIDKYGTNIKKVFKEYPEAEYICTAEDNGIYMLPFVNDRQNFCDLLYVNKTWLKAAGKSIPQTTDELRDVLAAFKKKYPSKTPLVCTSDAGQDVGPSVFGMFGISTYHNWLYIDDSNKVQFAPIANEYRDGLRYFNGLFSAGLLSFASGAPGGIFFPLLILGTYLGAIYAEAAIAWFGLAPELWQELVVVSMAGFFAAIVRAPMTGIILVFEMTGNLDSLLPLAVVSLTSYTLADLLGSTPIYTALLENLLRPEDKAASRRNRPGEKVLKGSALDGKCIKDIDWGRHCLIVSIERGDTAVTPKGDTTLHAGDTLVVMVSQRRFARDNDRLEALIDPKS